MASNRPRFAARTAQLLTCAIVAALLLLPAANRAQGAAKSFVESASSPAVPQTVDLATALAADGSFHGAAGASGTVDPHAWRLVSDLAAGEPPRFEAASVSSAASFPSAKWYAIDAGANGALNNGVKALAVSGTDLYVAGSFTDAAGLAQGDGVAKWNGSSWSALASVNGTINALAVANSSVYIGGTFTDLG